MDMSQFATLVSQAGLAGTLAIWFVYQGTKREDKFNTRIADLEQFQKQTLLSLVERNADLLSQNQHVLERCIATMDRWETHLDAIEQVYREQRQKANR